LNLTCDIGHHLSEGSTCIDGALTSKLALPDPIISLVQVETLLQGIVLLALRKSLTKDRVLARVIALA
jgi:hypothetical protein